MSDDTNLKTVMGISAELLEAGEYEKALKLLDEAIEAAIRKGESGSWIRTLCHHAAVIADFAGECDRVKSYYEQSLMYDAENPRALYGLAKSYLERGEAQMAKSYATRCREAIRHSNDREGQGLLELIAKRWPELSV